MKQTTENKAANVGFDRVLAARIFAEAGRELWRLSLIRGASWRTWRRQAQVAAAVLAAAGMLGLPGFVQPAAASTPVFVGPQALPSGGFVQHPVLGDIDGDGDLDLFTNGLYCETLFFENTGDATTPAFAAAQTNPFGLTNVGAGDCANEPALADIDGDGDLDLFVGEYHGNTIFLENTGNATAPAFAAGQTNPFGLSDVGDFSAPAFGDIDGDGDVDLLIGEFHGDSIFFENTGAATAPAFAAAQTNPFGLARVGSQLLNLSSPALADIDGDGDLDVFIGEYYGNTIFFENTGAATAPAFAAPQANPFGLTQVGNNAAPGFGDIDGDGDLDAFIGEYYGISNFFENQSQSFTSILGTKILLKDPLTGSDDTKRRAVVVLKEKLCAALLPGDPQDSGAVLQVFANTDTGTNGTQSACFDLDASGWSRIPKDPAKPVKGYKYKNKDDTNASRGDNPVRVVLVKQTGTNCILKTVLTGKDGANLTEPLPLEPPGDVTTAGVSLRMNDTGQGWCGGFGTDANSGNDPDPGGTLKEASNNGSPKLMLLRNPTGKGCPPPKVSCP